MKRDSICWDCQRAIADPTIGCSWSRRFKPVPGWDAEETIIPGGNGNKIKSYCVYDCPLFLRDEEVT